MMAASAAIFVFGGDRQGLQLYFVPIIA